MKKLVLVLFGSVTLLLYAMPTLAQPEPSVQAAMAPIRDIKNEVTLDIESRKKQVNAMLAGRDYNGLEKMARTLRFNKSELANGFWGLDNFYLAFAGRNDTEGQCVDRLKQLYDWVKAKPGSVTARVAYAGMLIQYAWLERGAGPAASVSDSDRAAMKKREDVASKILAEAGTAGEKCPRMWYLQLGLAKDNSMPAAYSEKLVADVRARFPSYKRASFSRACTLDERWGGAPGAVEAFAKKQADAVGGAAGDALYAQIVWYLDNLHMYQDQEFFRTLHFSWPRTEKGLQQILAKYPGNLAATSEYCHLACMAGDLKSARRLFSQLKGRVDLETWRNDEVFKWWRDYAFKQSK